MDYKDFHDGLISLASILFIFSLTFIIGSIVLKPYIALEPAERDYILIINTINLVFCCYYLLEGLRLDKIFKLEEKHVINFGKRIGIITLLFLPQLFTLLLLLTKGLHNLQLIMVYLILFIEILLIGLIFKETYDLLFKEEAERKLELDKNRKLYFDKEG
ncbi:MAG: hypothetical protein ACFE85_14145 [Candidatus Hodarchaeota archaeon]